ncbi:MAG: phosphatase PAP2 family protein [Burkholderiales bacterium]|nr:phosphatase PAP2 family protein [Burkholderiales bacterium]
MSAAARTPPTPPSPQAVTWDWRVLAAGALAIAAGLALHANAALNEAAFHAVNRFGPDAPAAWSALSVAGLALSAFIYLTACADEVPERVAQLLWGIVLGGLTASWIKHHLPSPRPFLALGAAHLNVIGTPLSAGSMPSGHSAMAFAMLAVLVAERRRFGERGAVDGVLTSNAGIALLALLAFGIALSRLAVGAHWPADALLGGGLGLIFGGLAPHAWPVGAMTRLLSRPLGQRLMAGGLLACAFCIAATPGLLEATGLAGRKWARNLLPGYPLAAPLQYVLALVALAGAVRWSRASGRAVLPD